MIDFPSGEMVGIFGPVSSGKTFLIKQWLKTQNRFVAFDYSGEMLEYEMYSQAPKALYERLKENRYFFQLSYLPGPEVELDFHYVLWSLWFLPVKKLLVCDEVHRICPVSGVNSDMETMLRFARHANLSFIGASQRIADVSKLFTSGCRTTILFHTREIRDIQAIDDRWGCGDLVRDLRPLIYDDYRKICTQTPQAVVCKKGQEPEVIEL